ncbi:hypothetical protein RchiOBHm_Chr4g0427471 [Rosa chinensis]|uniref:Sugar phosphate transporter domain-containing protein n=1 Tax=Rosa chinensis TaxID=74649 RepID=A0A2P6QZT9_ROSCH|nr:hypothetical protein RchiOBHm_Chr4g0427471 [Rosa chinensis]
MCVIPISAFFASSLWFGNTGYLHISGAFIQMLKALKSNLCGTDKPRCDVVSNMLLVSVGVVFSLYREIYFNVVGTLSQVTGIFAEALRLVLTQVLLQKKGLTLNPITSLYHIAPCSFTNSVQLLDFFSNALCALALNFSIFFVIGRTGAVTIRVAGISKFQLTSWSISSAALCGAVIYNYIKVKDVRASASQLPIDTIPDRISKERLEAKTLFASKEVEEEARKVSPKKFVPAEDTEMAEEQQSPKVAAIVNSQTLEEVARLEQALKSGQLPADLKILDEDTPMNTVKDKDDEMAVTNENEANVEVKDVEEQKNNEAESMDQE